MKALLTFKPRLSEKAYQQSQGGVYVFEIPLKANRLEVKDAIEKQYKVTVTAINTLVAKGKVKRTYKRSGRSVAGTRSDIKKAYVTLKKGDSLTIFASDEEQDKPKKTETKAKKAEKK